MVYPNPQIYHHIRTIFVHVPKAAGTSIEQALRASKSDIVGGHTTAVGFRRKFDGLFNQYYKFAVVRHPIDRFISAFHYLLQRPVHKALNNEVVHEAGSLSDFVARLKREKGLIQQIVHLMPQHQFLCDTDGKILVDSVFKFEQLDHAWREICERVGLPHRSLPRFNTSEHQRWESHATPDLAGLMEELYDRDFEIFNYPGWTETSRSNEHLLAAPCGTDDMQR